MSWPAFDTPAGKDCWVDLFELSQFRGTRRRFFGPGVWFALRSRAPNWGTCFDSLIVGPGAYVQIFPEADTAQAAWFLPGEQVVDLLHHQVSEAHNSMRLVTRPPGTGEPGYEEFVRRISGDLP